MANELIAEAITDYFGERCLDYAEGCPTCEAWAEYDRMNTRPAAPVDGLETVAYQYQIPRNGHWDNLPSDWTADECKAYDKKETRELVTRSQAEAIIAAKDATLQDAIECVKVLTDDKNKLETQLAAARKAAREAHDTLIEINPSNYNHDDVCQMNDASVEAIFLLADVLGETHGKTAEWWELRRAALEDKL